MDAAREKLEATTRWDPAEVEARIFDAWDASGAFDPPAEGTPAENYSIAIPPPNVTGALHMGHALNGTVQDTLIRLRADARAATRSGSSAPTTPGSGPRRWSRRSCAPRASPVTSSAARRSSSASGSGGAVRLADRRAVQAPRRLLRLRARAVHARRGLRAGGLPGLRRAATRKGHIYRDNYMVNWDPGSRSAISDLEVVNREVTDTLYEIDYPVEGSGEVLTVATVRPETMLADTAVAVHPDDERYRHARRRPCVLPLVGRRLPIIADEHVDPEFGTGALKITPGHDPDDFEIGRRHGLEETRRDRRGRADERRGGGELRGHDRRRGARGGGRGAARARAALRGEQPYAHSVPFSHRSGRADRAADLAAVVLSHGRARGAGDRGRRARRGPDHARAAQARLPRLDERTSGPGASRASSGGATGSRSGTGPTARRSSPSPRSWRARRPPSAGSTPTRCARTRTCSTPGSPRRCGRSRPSAGPTRTRPAAGLLPDRAFLTTARDILFLWVARMVMMGIEFTGDVPSTTSTSPDHPGTRRAADVEVAGHRDRPARRDRRPRRRRAALRPAGDVLDPGRALLGRPVQQGRDLANKMWNASRLILLNAGGASPAGRGARGRGRGPLDPLAAAAGDRVGHAAASTSTTSPTRRSTSTLLLVRVLRLVSGDRQAAALRR